MIYLGQIYTIKFSGCKYTIFVYLPYDHTVKDSYVFQIPIYSSNNYDGLVGPYLWEKFSFVELTEIMRQKDDLNFARALRVFTGRRKLYFP